MSTITTRTAKGSKLTTAEMDQNLTNLNNDKLEASEFTANNTILLKDKDGNRVAVAIAEIQVIGRLTGGNVKGLNMTELKDLMALEIDSIAGLQEALDLKADDADLVTAQDDITALETDVADLEAAVATIETNLNGMTVFAKGADTLVAGTKATTVALMLATDYVVVGRLTSGGTPGALFTLGAEAGGFTCKSTDVADNSTFFFIVFRAA